MLYTLNIKARSLFRPITSTVTVGHSFACHPVQQLHNKLSFKVASTKKQGRTWKCNHCGEYYKGQFRGDCPSCSSWGELEEVDSIPEVRVEIPSGNAGLAVAEKIFSRSKTVFLESDEYDAPPKDITLRPFGATRAWLNNQSGPTPLASIGYKQQNRTPRIQLSGKTGEEIGRVLGGGVVPGSLVIVGGDPGVGKSTLLLQLSAMLAHPELDFDQIEDDAGDEAFEDDSEQVNVEECDVGIPAKSNGSSPPLQEASITGNAGYLRRLQPVLYITGEEMVEQVYDRAHRMRLSSCVNLLVVAETNMEQIAQYIADYAPLAVVIDSIQTAYLPEAKGTIGGTTQLKECTAAAMKIAKETSTAIFMIGHVTKDSSIAGPQTMLHMVDACLYLEGDMGGVYRLLRVSKNRYGPTEAVGLFRMDATGLHVVESPAEILLQSRTEGNTRAASVVGIVMEGQRPLILEVQALVTSQPDHLISVMPPSRQSTCVSKERFLLIVEVLRKFVPTMRLASYNIFVNVVGGLQMREPAADAAIAVAIASSYFSVPLGAGVAVVGEVDLGGGLRSVRNLELRLSELVKLGLTKAVVPRVKHIEKLQASKKLEGLELVACTTIGAALREVLGDVVDRRPKDDEEGGQKKSRQKE